MSIHYPVPILDHDPSEPSAFLPGNLMGISRRQRGLTLHQAPKGCLLDFDGELLEHLVAADRARPDPDWPCFHTQLYRWTSGPEEFGIIGGTIGAPFAVLVAEELFAYGCDALVSIGSAGLVGGDFQPPFFLMVERSVRDEGTSYHYLSPTAFVEADRELLRQVKAALDRVGMAVHLAATWTTDAPFRETSSRIATYRDQGIVAVEMEAAALLSFAAARGRKIVCFSHVTNQMATSQTDFNKGGQSGYEYAIRLCEDTLHSLLALDPVNGS